MNLRSIGYRGDMDFEMQEGILPARVTAVHKERFEVICDRGIIKASVKRGAYQKKESEEKFPAVGDFVLLRYEEIGDSLIIKTLPRHSKFSRSNYSGHAAGYVKTVLEQTVAANFDYVFLMASLNHDFNVARMERYLAMSHHSGAQPVILLTKADVAIDAEYKLLKAKQSAGMAPIFIISAHTGQGLQELKQYFAPGMTSVFLGSSGVGKSSLVNAMAGAEVMSVSSIREDDSKGRHTTTHRQMIFLKNGAMIIDTPGLRELGMWEAEEGLGQTFSDVELYLGKCRFSNCSHRSEPGCAIRAAIQAGELDQNRMERYLRLSGETKFVQRKAKPAHKMAGGRPKVSGPIKDD